MMSHTELHEALQKQKELEKQIESLTEKLEELSKLSGIIGMRPPTTDEQVGLI